MVMIKAINYYLMTGNPTLIATFKKKENATTPPISAIFNFSRKIILAAIEAIIGAVKLNTVA